MWQFILGTMALLVLSACIIAYQARTGNLALVREMFPEKRSMLLQELRNIPTPPAAWLCGDDGEVYSSFSYNYVSTGISFRTESTLAEIMSYFDAYMGAHGWHFGNLTGVREREYRKGDQTVTLIYDPAIYRPNGGCRPGSGTYRGYDFSIRLLIDQWAYSRRLLHLPPALGDTQ